MDVLVPAKHSNRDYIIAPREICQSCASLSGPKFLLERLPAFPMTELRQNNVPTGLDRERKQSIVNQAESDLTWLDQEIDRLQESLSKFRQVREELHALKTQHESLLAPIRKLPIDILQYIFLIYQQSRVTDGFINVHWSVARCIDQVSFFWRSAANAYSLLWARFSVTDIHPSFNKKEHFLKECLRKSGEAPLSMELEIKPRQLGTASLKALAGSCHRWETIFINGTLLNEISIHMPSTQVSFPYLKSLSTDDDINELTASCFKSAPLLARIGIKFTDNSSTSGLLRQLPDVPWSQIKYFSVQGGSWFCENMSRRLKDMSNLTSLTLTTLSLGAPKVDILLPHLQRLEVVICDAGLQVLITPNLKAFKIRGPIIDTKIITEFLGRSGCSLEELSTNGNHSDELWMMAEELRGLKRLHIHWEGFIRSITRGLGLLSRQKDPHLSPFPKLEIITLSIEGERLEETNAVEKLLISMIKSRLPPSSALDNAREKSPEDIAFLRSVFVRFHRRLIAGELSAMVDFKYSTAVRLAGLEVEYEHGKHLTM